MIFWTDYDLVAGNSNTELTKNVTDIVIFQHEIENLVKNNVSLLFIETCVLGITVILKQFSKF